MANFQYPASKLLHTSHDQRGSAKILRDGGTPQETVVGKSKRTRHIVPGNVFYTYRLTDLKGKVVYDGGSISEGLRRFENWLQG